MAAASLLALLDDITLVLDDVAVMTKVAAKKTAGVLGDDLALNAQQVAGIRAERELPVVWKVAVGSLVNKAILVPVALIISVFAPWAILPLLMIGGLFLCFEGVEKLAHKFLHSKAEDDAHHAELVKTLADPSADMVAFERDKIKGAVRTDFILSAEIIVITLGTVADKPLLTKAAVLIGISLLMTVGVYGLVAGIVKMDDAGLWLSRQAGMLQRKIGAVLLVAAPALMKFLAIAGTAAMFLVGGGILVHGIGPLHHAVEAWTQAAGGLGWLVEPVVGGLAGIVAGAIVLAIVSVGKKLFVRSASPA
jgi:predicted DNA repair protein MutK